MVGPPLDTLKSIVRGCGYMLALMGAAVGGFPPPRLFAREELPAVVIEHVMDHTELEDLDGWDSEWGFRVDRSRRPASPLPRLPETPR